MNTQPYYNSRRLGPFELEHGLDPDGERRARLNIRPFALQFHVEVSAW